LDKEIEKKEKQIPLQKVEPQIVPEKNKLTEIDTRIHNLEKLYDTIENVMEGAIDTYNKYLIQKTESEKQSQTFEDNQHKRGSWVIVYALTVIIVFCVFCLFKEQYELIKLILTSSFAVGAGAGLSSIWSKKSKK
jgi:hypothetical protein